MFNSEILLFEVVVNVMGDWFSLRGQKELSSSSSRRKTALFTGWVFWFVREFGARTNLLRR